MKCLKVPKSKGEEVRKILLRRSLVSNEHKIRSENGYLLLPLITDEVDLDYPVVERDMEELELPPSSLSDIIELPPGFETELPSSYDIVGDIILLKISDNLEPHKKKLGEALLKLHKNVKVVLEDRGVEGELRIRDVVHLAGEERTRTVHREHGAEYVVDLSKAYFSPRLATERWRVVRRVRPGERILDMFTGVGPYSILIAKNTKVEKVYAVDLNPEAVSLLDENVRRNKVEDIIETVQGDVRDVKVKADRIIMNLPHSARNFLPHALKSLDSKGYIHYYEVMPIDGMGSLEEELKSTIKHLGFSAKIIEVREVRTYSASKVHAAVDIKACLG
ncbi:MAG: class I SAM-dependent methyltransferase family protein [Thermoplasmata archaeon]